MLQEVRRTRQIPGEPHRRWFRDETFDLFVWYASRDNITGFQLTYSVMGEERALIWSQDIGFSHNRVDDGEGRPGRHKMTPTILPDGQFDGRYVLELFEAACTEIDPEVVEVVTRKIKEYPEKRMME